MRRSSIFVWLWAGLVLLGSPGAPGPLLAQEKPKPSASQLDPLVDLLLEVPDAGVQLDVLKGLHQAVRGQRNLPIPARWLEVSRQLSQSPNGEVRRLVQALSLIFGDPQAMRTLRALVSNHQADFKDRCEALSALVQVRDEKLLPILQSCVESGELREAALQGLAAYHSPATPGLILTHYVKFTATERQAALHVLVSRRDSAMKLLEAIEANRIQATELSTYLVRQMAAFEDKPLNTKLRRVWGEFRPTSADKAVKIRELKSQLTQTQKHGPPEELALGRLVFAKTCAACHVLFDDGREVGPNLTGSQRGNVDYVLENVLDPSAVVGRDYRLTTLATTSGRILTGMVAEESRESLVLKTPTENVLIATGDVADRKLSRLSMMPEGLLEKLSPAEIRDLIAYLASSTQVPLPQNAP